MGARGGPTGANKIPSKGDNSKIEPSKGDNGIRPKVIITRPKVSVNRPKVMINRPKVMTE